VTTREFISYFLFLFCFSFLFLNKSDIASFNTLSRLSCLFLESAWYCFRKMDDDDLTFFFTLKNLNWEYLGEYSLVE
jgi:hypothetical protein